MTKSYLRKLNNHTYINNIRIIDYLSIKEEIINDLFMKYLYQNNPIIDYCFKNMILSKTNDIYRFYNQRKLLFDLWRDFEKQITEFKEIKKKIYTKELEHRNRYKLLKPFVQK